MLGIGFSISDVQDDVLPEIDVINIENPLYPNYLSSDFSADVEAFLQKDYGKTIITDGSYIDLNPGTPEKAISEIVKAKVQQSIEFAVSVGSDEIIFLSTFLPMIGMDFYDRGHVDNSICFWKEVMAVNRGIRVSICNVFEYNPDILLEIMKGVESDNFGLAFDVGHAFAYGNVTLKEFFGSMEPHCKSVYLHSNSKSADEHLDVFEGDLLKSGQFQDIIPLLCEKNVILKPFDKSRLHKNISVLKEMFAL